MLFVPICIASVLIMGVAALVGCQSGKGPPRTSRCDLVPGMDTDQLSLCGCVSTETRGGYRQQLFSQNQRNSGESVSIVNYICPMGSAGVAQMIVLNGITQRILY